MIAKLMLNSLYGRFGMKIFETITEIVDADKMKDIISKHEIIEHEQLANTNKEFVRYNAIPNEELCKQFDIDFENELGKWDSKSIQYNISISIASAITAYARIYMN